MMSCVAAFQSPLFNTPSAGVRSVVAPHAQAYYPTRLRGWASGGGKTLLVSSTRIRPIRCLSALSPELKANLDKVVTSQKVILFMKGTKEFPQCGFSNTVVQILKTLNVPFETIDILENEFLRQGLKEYSNWPTFPQLYIDGEFYGGCDITVGEFIML
ncbi:hypothetical protein RJ640_028233 [Escallonia rubra]|uniref:Glutaredoxin domain-containing protein n=1 Tax=Escallonia rubra TaxID=112253 RepID=A0AA88QT29_9ASTE|nr:hypothetical protein RJ640_028233 [Escallonia rubra]